MAAKTVGIAVSDELRPALDEVVEHYGHGNRTCSALFASCEPLASRRQPSKRLPQPSRKCVSSQTAGSSSRRHATMGSAITICTLMGPPGTTELIMRPREFVRNAVTRFR